MWNKPMWSLGILAATVGWAVVTVLADAQRRKHNAKEVAQQVHEWESEGGAARPASLDGL